MGIQKFLITWMFFVFANLLNAQNVQFVGDKDSLACDTIISLEGIDVVARRATVKLIGNNLVIDVEHDSILNRQNNIYEVLAKTPGIIRMGQSIVVAGKGQPIYYINGRKVKNQNVLDNLQVDQVKSIKVLPTPNANYDSSGAPIVDIKTKRLGEGFAFNTIGNIAQARHLSQNYGFSSTYNRKKIDLLLGYNYSNGKTKTMDTYMRQVVADTIWNKEQNAESLTRSYNHNVNTAIVYHLSDRTEMGIQYDGTFLKRKGAKKNMTSVVSNVGTSSLISDIQDCNESSSFHHVSAYYETKFNHNWHLSAITDYIHKKSTNKTFIQEIEERTTNLNYDSWSCWDVVSANIQASHDFASCGNLRFGYDFSHSHGIDGVEYVRSLYNGKTKNKEIKNALFVNYEVPIHDFSLSAGVRYENLFSTMNEFAMNKLSHRHENNFMPTLNVSYSKGLLMQNISYSYGTNRANFSDMNNNIIYVNKYEWIKGNTNIMTELEHNVSYLLMYKFLYATLNYSYIRHPLLTEIYSLPNQSSITISTQGNLSRRQIMSIMLNARNSVAFWSFSLTGFLQKSFVHYPGANGIMLNDKQPLCMINFDNDFRLSKKTLISFGFKQLFGGYLETIKLKALSSFNFSLKSSFFQDRLWLSIDANDIFNGDKNRSSRQINNVIMSGSTKYETRKIGLTLTYRFRKKIERRMKTSASVEMKRLEMNREE